MTRSFLMYWINRKRVLLFVLMFLTVCFIPFIRVSKYCQSIDEPWAILSGKQTVYHYNFPYLIVATRIYLEPSCCGFTYEYGLYKPLFLYWEVEGW